MAYPGIFNGCGAKNFQLKIRMKICLLFASEAFFAFQISPAPPPHLTHVVITYYIIIDIFSGHCLLANSSTVIRITLTHSSVYGSASGIRLVENLSHKPSPSHCVIHGLSQSGTCDYSMTPRVPYPGYLTVLDSSGSPSQDT